MRMGFLVLALLLLAGLAYRQLWSVDDHAPPSLPAPVPSAPRPQMKQQALPEPPRPAAPVASPPRADVVRRLRLQRELWRGNDWLGFMRENLPLAQAGDAEAQLQIGTALQWCKEVAKNSATQSGDGAAQANDAAVARFFAQRCGALEQLPQDQLGTARQWFQLAAGQGNGMALLQLAADAGSDEPRDQRVADLHRAIASSDPSVISLLVSSAAAGQGADTAPAELDQNTQFAVEALTICAMGYDCSASGPIYDTLLCRRKGCLHADGVQRYYELSLSLQQFAVAQAYSQRLAANLGSGRYDWPEAQALQKQLLDAANGDDAGATPPNP